MIGKLGYINFRGLNITGSAYTYEYSFILNGVYMFNDYSWVDVCISNGKSISDCGLVADDYGCHMQTMKTTSNDLRLSGFVVFELA